MLLMEEYPPPLLFWSLAVHIGVCLIILQTQAILRCYMQPRSSTFRTVSELLFSVGWVVLTLENTLLFHMRSEVSGVTALGLRLFISPMLFRKVFGNPCEVLYYHLTRSSRYRRSTSSMLGHAILAQMVAVPVGVALSLLLWKLLASVNDDYSTFVKQDLEYFLSVQPMTGFLVEAFISFLTFMPGIFLPQTLFCNLLETLFVVGIVCQFGVMTGAFMNPMAAVSSLLMWHATSLEAWDLGVHVLVFILGPLCGTLLAVKVARWRHRKHD